MPFESKAQRRFMHANHPKIAKRWEHEYPRSLSDLPEHVAKKKSRSRRRKRG